MGSYYKEKLSAERLKQCYDLAPPAVQRYLKAEIDYLSTKLRHGMWVLELGCGYGRVIEKLAPRTKLIMGIDTAYENLRFARRYLAGLPNTGLVVMDAVHLAFPAATFDLTVCIQNGISAFHVDEQALINSSIRVTRKGGRVMFSSYAEEFWDDRLAWFRIQAKHGLIGEIDETATGNGVIVGTDGFTASTVSQKRFQELTRDLGKRVGIRVIAGSSVFCEIRV